MPLYEKISEPIKVAVITGSHPFEVINFHHLFRSMTNVDAYIQHINDFACSAQEVRDSYDVLLFYHFILEMPKDEGIPWYEGTPKTALEHLRDTHQGIVVLHHGILSFQDWQVWNDIVGIPDRKWDNHVGQNINIKITDPAHPITFELKDWEMVDETYTMASASEGSQALLTVEHPLSMQVLGWAREYKNSRVFCYQSGHDDLAYSDPNYRVVLERGIKWVARRI